MHSLCGLRREARWQTYTEHREVSVVWFACVLLSFPLGSVSHSPLVFIIIAIYGYRTLVICKFYPHASGAMGAIHTHTHTRMRALARFTLIYALFRTCIKSRNCLHACLPAWMAAYTDIGMNASVHYWGSALHPAHSCFSRAEHANNYII